MSTITETEETSLRIPFKDWAEDGKGRKAMVARYLGGLWCLGKENALQKQLKGRLGCDKIREGLFFFVNSGTIGSKVL